jgi:hypothetical protein
VWLFGNCNPAGPAAIPQRPASRPAAVTRTAARARVRRQRPSTQTNSVAAAQSCRRSESRSPRLCRPLRRATVTVTGPTTGSCESPGPDPVGVRAGGCPAAGPLICRANYRHSASAARRRPGHSSAAAQPACFPSLTVSGTVLPPAAEGPSYSESLAVTVTRTVPAETLFWPS